MNLKVSKITEDVFVLKDEICSLEFERVKGYQSMERFGTIMTLKNGRKIYVKEMRPEQVIEKLNSMGEEKNAVQL
jgi:hypothetical protein